MNVMCSLLFWLPSVECCNDKWIRPNLAAMEADLANKVHGQPLVLTSVMSSIEGHVLDGDPPKALLLSFHGWPGNGKNLVSKIIANNTYVRGMESQFVHLYTPDRFPHASKVNEYKEWLTQDIEASVSSCERSLFIFDDVINIPDGILDTISSYVDYHTTFNNINFRKSIFMFLSNLGGRAINQIAMKYSENGRPSTKRDDIPLEELEQSIMTEATNYKGGLWKSKLIDRGLINTFVPFLPMDRPNVRLCVRDALRQRGPDYGVDEEDAVLNRIQWFSSGSQMYAKHGCKPVYDKVNLVLGARRRALQRNEL